MVKATDLTDASVAQEEARELHRLRHPGIVRYVSDFLHSTPAGPAQQGGLWVCILMEHCDTDLRKLVETVRARGARIRERIALRVIGRVAQALEYCHGLGVAHRDIKSQNIFICRSGEYSVKLGDFGLARDSEGVTTLTTAGTDCYKSPEALLGTRRDARCDDMWSLGLVLHELLSNRFAWERSGSLGARVLGNEAKALKEWLRALPRDITGECRRVLRQLVCKDPRQRLSSAALCRDGVVLAAMQRGRQASAAPCRATPGRLPDPPAWGDSMAAVAQAPATLPGHIAPGRTRPEPLADRMESRRSLLAGLGGELDRPPQARRLDAGAFVPDLVGLVADDAAAQDAIAKDSENASSSGSESMRRAVVVAARTNWAHPGGAAQAAREQAARHRHSPPSGGPASGDGDSGSGSGSDSDKEEGGHSGGPAATASPADPNPAMALEGGWRIAKGKRRQRRME